MTKALLLPCDVEVQVVLETFTQVIVPLVGVMLLKPFVQLVPSLANVATKRDGAERLIKRADLRKCKHIHRHSI